jgi:hypothetical protein
VVNDHDHDQHKVCVQREVYVKKRGVKKNNTARDGLHTVVHVCGCVGMSNYGGDTG